MGAKSSSESSLKCTWFLPGLLAFIDFELSSESLIFIFGFFDGTGFFGLVFIPLKESSLDLKLLFNALFFLGAKSSSESSLMVIFCFWFLLFLVFFSKSESSLKSSIIFLTFDFFSILGSSSESSLNTGLFFDSFFLFFGFSSSSSESLNLCGSGFLRRFTFFVSSSSESSLKTKPRLLPFVCLKVSSLSLSLSLLKLFFKSFPFFEEFLPFTNWLKLYDVPYK